MNSELKKFILYETFRKFNTYDYMNAGKGFTLFLKHLTYNSKPLFDYISKDLNKSNPLEFIYLLLNNTQPSKCKVCGNISIFENLRKGYRPYCSIKCSSNDKDRIVKITNKLKQTNLDKYGFENVFQNKKIKDKSKQTCLNRYGVDNISKSNLFKEKVKHTNLQKYGVENVFQNKNVQKKYKQTCLDKYGVIYPSKVESVKEKIKQTNLNRYGVIHPSKTKVFQNKVKNTLLEKYGVINIFQLDSVKEKSKQTLLCKYGTDSPLKCKDIQEKKKQTCLNKYGGEYANKLDYIKEKFRQTCLNKYGVDNPSKYTLFKDTKEKKFRESFYNKLINSDRLKNLVKPNFTLDEYINVSDKYSFTCLKCNYKFESSLNNGMIPRCPICYPKLLNNVSKYETEIYDFLKENLDKNEVIERSNRTILNGLELDIYIPNKKLAIEFNGLYWHSELNGRAPNYHINKTTQCINKKIQLIHIFEDEWIEKQEIVKSILLNKLNITPNKIFARKCHIKKLKNDLTFNFLDANHLQGFINGVHFGLYCNNELISCLTIGKSRFNKNFEYEILRFCSKNYHNVIGAFGKLFKYFVNKYNPKSIITYCDLRYGIGNVYHKNGFDYINNSNPNYYYLDKNFRRLSRLQFQKHLLENKLDQFDSNLTEWENMQLNGYNRIWDCGNAIYSWKREILNVL